jgi:hypothetical protein
MRWLSLIQPGRIERYCILLTLCTTVLYFALRAVSGAFTTATLLQLPKDVQPRAVALLFFGRLSKRGDLDDLRGCFPYMQRNVLDPAVRDGWTVDTFFHTYDGQDGNMAALRELLKPRNASVGALGACTYRGTSYCMIPSIEEALALMHHHVRVARRGRPYDAVLISRFDTMFLQPFSFDKLTDASAVYVASWCKATHPVPPGTKTPPGVFGCFGLERFWGDEEGVPDFFFAGAPTPLLNLFMGLGAGLAAGTVRPGRTPPGHGLVWGGIQARNTTVKRYLLHHVDVAIYRRGLLCNEVAMAPWLRGGGPRGNATPAIESAASLCGDGRFICARDEKDVKEALAGCAVFLFEPRQW